MDKVHVNCLTPWGHQLWLLVPGALCKPASKACSLMQDALDEIARQKPRDVFKPLRVHFIGEDGIDAGGVKSRCVTTASAHMTVHVTMTCSRPSHCVSMACYYTTCLYLGFKVALILCYMWQSHFSLQQALV